MAGHPEGSGIGGKRSLVDGEDRPEGTVQEAGRPQGSGNGGKRSLVDSRGGW